MPYSDAIVEPIGVMFETFQPAPLPIAHATIVASRVLDTLPLVAPPLTVRIILQRPVVC
jgi:hypothetical protein